MYYTPEEQKILAQIAGSSKGKDLKRSISRKQRRKQRSRIQGCLGLVEHAKVNPLRFMELLVRARSWPYPCVELCSVVIGDKVEIFAGVLCLWGFRVYVIDVPVFHYYRTETYYKASVIW